MLCVYKYVVCTHTDTVVSIRKDILQYQKDVAHPPEHGIGHELTLRLLPHSVWDVGSILESDRKFCCSELLQSTT